MQFPLLALAISLLVLVLRSRLPGRIMPWHAMALGAAIVLATGLPLVTALGYVNWTVILFLAGMFSFTSFLEREGVFRSVASRLALRAKNARQMLWLVLAASAVGSALFVNDSIAIIGVPIILAFTRSSRKAMPLIMALAFGVTIGSLATPLGNPQNLMVAEHLQQPFITFATYLLLPALVLLLICGRVLEAFYWRELDSLSILPPSLGERPGAAAILVVLFFITLLVVKVALSLAGFNLLPLWAIAVAGGAAAALASKDKRALARGFDWQTIALFACMFVVVEAAWATGELSFLRQYAASMPSIIVTSFLASQVVSNVPLVALMLKAMPLQAGYLVALAASSTLAGSLTIMGAASNLIIIQQYERHTGAHFSATEFSKVGMVISLASIILLLLLLRQ